MTAESGRPPWDDPELVITVPTRRGPAKPRTAKPATAASRKWVYRPPRVIPEDTVSLVDCPRCGTLVLTGRVDGYWWVTLDIWQVPYSDAVVLARYNVSLFRLVGNARNIATGWAPWNKVSAIRLHDCDNRWWRNGPYIGYRNDYVGDDVYL